jgi:methyl-accepting chemotaxis protein
VDNLSKIRHTILSLSNTCAGVANRAQSVRAEIGNISAAIEEFKTLGNTVSHGSHATNQTSENLIKTAQQLNGLAAKFKV